MTEYTIFYSSKSKYGLSAAGDYVSDTHPFDCKETTLNIAKEMCGIECPAIIHSSKEYKSTSRIHLERKVRTVKILDKTGEIWSLGAIYE